MNEYFQSDKVIIADIYSKMEYTYKELLYCFLKKSYVDHNEIWNVDPLNENEYLELSFLYLGVNVLNELNSEKISNRPDLKQFFFEKITRILVKTLFPTKA